MHVIEVIISTRQRFVLKKRASARPSKRLVFPPSTLRR